MGKIKWLLAVAFILALNVSSNAGDKKIKFKALPRTAQEFYTANFGTMKIKSIEYDTMDKKYEIEFWNDNSIQFNNSGEWIEIDFDKNTPIPMSVIESMPMMTRAAFLKKYAKNIVTEIEKKMHDPSDVKYKIKMHSPTDPSSFEIMIDSKGNITMHND